jgi:hypothetical protein
MLYTRKKKTGAGPDVDDDASDPYRESTALPVSVAHTQTHASTRDVRVR